MRLTDAKFCVDCEEVYEGAKEVCPLCACSRSVWLYRWLMPRVPTRDVPDLSFREQMLRYGRVAAAS